MNKTTSTTLLLIFGQALLAQKFTGFYIEPNASEKLETMLSTNREPPLETPYFKIEQKKTIPPKDFAPLLLGLNFGYCFKNNNKLQFGIAQDGVGLGFDLHGIEKVQSKKPNDYGITKFGGNTGPSCTNISLLYKWNILNIRSSTFKKDRFILVHLNLGLTYFYKPNNGITELSTSGWSYYSLDSNYVEVAVRPYNYPVDFKYSFKYNLGLDFTFGKKDREWFSLNVSFITNRSNGAVYAVTNIDISVSNKTDKKIYYYNLKGTGNGFYFTLSKRIYPIKLYKRIEAKRLEKYEQLKN